MRKILLCFTVFALVMGAFAACSGQQPSNDQNANDLSGTYDITVWVSEKEGVTALTQQQIRAFETANPGIVINATISGVAEADAGTLIVTDVASAPDIYCFAQDQLARLVQASALAQPGQAAAAQIKENNDEASVTAASVAGQLYAYPMTSDNGYYMYYDTSVITNPDDLHQIITDCENSGKLIRYALEDGWYTASFFFATGCYSNWTMDEKGKFVSVEDNFNSPQGLAAMKGMQMLTQSSAYDSNGDIFSDAAVVVTGIWNAEAAQAHFGENLGVTDLPSFTVDGNTYHLGSFSGQKLMGVKPQTDAKKAAVASQLAQYLTGEACQMDRYEKFQWGPSNKAAQASQAVQSNASLAALAKQNQYSIPQAQIHGSWWDIVKILGAEAKAATSQEDLQAALDQYQANLDSLLAG